MSEFVKTFQLSDLKERYAFLDPAGSKRGSDPRLRKTTARSAIVVIGVDAATRIFVLHAWADRCSVSTLVQQVQAVHRNFNPRLFGIEANAMQFLFAESVQLMANMQGIQLPIVPIKQPTNIQKEWRIRAALQEPWAQGRLFFQQDQVELIDELRGFPLAATVDIVDALASAVAMIPQRLPPKGEKDDEVAEYAAYLRQAGASPSYIQRNVARMRRGEDVEDYEPIT